MDIILFNPPTSHWGSHYPLFQRRENRDSEKFSNLPKMALSGHGQSGLEPRSIRSPNPCPFTISNIPAIWTNDCRVIIATGSNPSIFTQSIDCCLNNFSHTYFPVIPGFVGAVVIFKHKWMWANWAHSGFLSLYIFSTNNNGSSRALTGTVGLVGRW